MIANKYTKEVYDEEKIEEQINTLLQQFDELEIYQCKDLYINIKEDEYEFYIRKGIQEVLFALNCSDYDINGNFNIMFIKEMEEFYKLVLKEFEGIFPKVEPF